MGKANFIDIRDRSGRIQVYVRINDVGEDTFAKFKKWDIGDILEVRGTVFKTRRGEISIHATALRLLTKSLLPLPEKFHGLRDTDTRYRRRYLDLIVNPDVKDTFIKKKPDNPRDKKLSRFQGLHRGRDAYSCSECGRRRRTSVCDTPQRSQRGFEPAHIPRALPQAPHSRRT